MSADVVTEEQMLQLGVLLADAARHIISFTELRMKKKPWRGAVRGYPWMGKRTNGTHYFHDAYGTKEGAPPDYTAAFEGESLLGGPLDGFSDEDLVPVMALAKYLAGIPAIAKRFASQWSIEYEAKSLVVNAVLRYLYVYRTDVVDEDKLHRTCWPIVKGLSAEELGLALVVPIVMNTFEPKYFRLNPETYIMRMSKPLQLARSRVGSWDSGVAKGVAHAATHAFVSTDWSITNMAPIDLGGALTSIRSEQLEYVDRFFAALRIVTNTVSGYAQVLYIPRRWAYRWQWDLPAVYGSTHRRYPGQFDRIFYEENTVAQVATVDLEKVKRAYGKIMRSNNSKIGLALRRLNACVTRDDDIDAILDAIIGLEILLGEKGDSINYKLRMRVSGLAKKSNGTMSPQQAYKDISKLYATRSEIVHGNIPTKGAKHIGLRQTRYAEHRVLATDYLRFVIDVLLENERYLEPANIDLDLLVGGGSEADSQETPDMFPVDHNI